MKPLALAAVLGAACAGCIGGVEPVQCIFATDCSPGESCRAGFCQLEPPTCPKLQPTFTSINNDFFQVGCGAKSNKCHGDAAVAEGVSGLSLQTKPYDALANAPADRVPGRPQGILRVRPGDAVHSLLVIKLKLKTDDDPTYGASMPFDNPGAICQQTIDVVSAWIAAGAKND